MAPSLVIKFPSEAEEQRARAFRVHKNYLSAVAAYLFDQYGPPDELLGGIVKEQKRIAAYRTMQSIRPDDEGVIRRFLTISWASELQLRLGASREVPTLRYSNVWAPVHAYYAVYMSLQAWFAANGMAHLVNDHTRSLRTISNMIASRELFPPPFNVTCRGCPQLKEIEFARVPVGQDARQSVQVLSSPTAESFWPRFGTLLRTTRRDRLERNFSEWKRRHDRKAMFKDEKRKVATNLTPTTFFDFLWRIRIRSNYHDVSSFLTWNVADIEQQEYSESLVTITDCVCGLIESLLIRRIGVGVYRNQTQTFVASGDSGVELQRTLDFLRFRLNVLTESA